MSAPMFYFRDGALWHGAYWWPRDQMERQAVHFETRSNHELSAEWARQCREALAQYDHWEESLAA